MVLVLAVLLVTLGIIHLEGKTGASLVVQWIRICLPVQKKGFNPWVRKIPRRRK